MAVVPNLGVITPRGVKWQSWRGNGVSLLYTYTAYACDVKIGTVTYLPTLVYIQGVPGGKENILNDDSIDNFEKKMSNKHMLKSA